VVRLGVESVFLLQPSFLRSIQLAKKLGLFDCFQILCEQKVSFPFLAHWLDYCKLE
jgi:hypothetical protein